MSFFNQTYKQINISTSEIVDPTNRTHISNFSNRITFDLILFKEYINRIVFPIIDTLTSKPRYPKDVLESGISGETIVSWLESQGNSNSSSELYWNIIGQRPKTIKESLDYLSSRTSNSIVQNITNVNADIDGLRSEVLTLIQEMTDTIDCNSENTFRLARDVYGTGYVLNCQSNISITPALYTAHSNALNSLGLTPSGLRNNYSSINYILNTDTHSSAIGKLDTKLKDLNDTKVSSSLIGAANGVAPLSASSKIDAAYLPSYVDDVIEYANQAAFPATGESGKIYVDLNVNKIYRWATTVYVEVSPGSDSVLTGINVSGAITKSGDALNPTIGIDSSSLNTNSTVVERNASGSFAANEITANAFKTAAGNLIIDSYLGNPRIRNSVGNSLSFQSSGGSSIFYGMLETFSKLSITGASSDITFNNAGPSIKFNISDYNRPDEYENIIFNEDATSPPTASITPLVVRRASGGQNDAKLRWDETADRWEFNQKLRAGNVLIGDSLTENDTNTITTTSGNLILDAQNDTVIVNSNLDTHGTLRFHTDKINVIKHNNQVGGLYLNSEYPDTSAPTDSITAIEIERGNAYNAKLEWDEILDRWKFNAPVYIQGLLTATSYNLALDDLSNVTSLNPNQRDVLYKGDTDWISGSITNVVNREKYPFNISGYFQGPPFVANAQTVQKTLFHWYNYTSEAITITGYSVTVGDTNNDTDTSTYKLVKYTSLNDFKTNNYTEVVNSELTVECDAAYHLASNNMTLAEAVVIYSNQYIGIIATAVANTNSDYRLTFNIHSYMNVIKP